MPTTYTNIPKPTTTDYSNVNGVGREQYDQPDIEYDASNVFYDGTNPSQYTNITKPSGTVYTNIAKPN